MSAVIGAAKARMRQIFTALAVKANTIKKELTKYRVELKGLSLEDM